MFKKYLYGSLILMMVLMPFLAYAASQPTIIQDSAGDQSQVTDGRLHTQPLPKAVTSQVFTIDTSVKPNTGTLYGVLAAFHSCTLGDKVEFRDSPNSTSGTALVTLVAEAPLSSDGSCYTNVAFMPVVPVAFSTGIYIDETINNTGDITSVVVYE